MNNSVPNHFSSLFKICLIYFIAVLYPSYASTDTRNAAQNWYVVSGFNPVTRKQDCYMRSADTTILIGEDETRIYLLLTGQKLYVVTNSIIDTSYSNSRIVVDKLDAIPVKQYTNKETAQIDKFDPEYLAQFIRGYRASVYMGYWPSWSKTGLQEAQFNLIGFTVTYTDYIQCQARSDILTATGE